jgi:hypothetical protein
MTFVAGFAFEIEALIKWAGRKGSPNADGPSAFALMSMEAIDRGSDLLPIESAPDDSPSHLLMLLVTYRGTLAPDGGFTTRDNQIGRYRGKPERVMERWLKSQGFVPTDYCFLTYPD